MNCWCCAVASAVLSWVMEKGVTLAEWLTGWLTGRLSSNKNTLFIFVHGCALYRHAKKWTEEGKKERRGWMHFGYWLGLLSLASSRLDAIIPHRRRVLSLEWLDTRVYVAHCSNSQAPLDSNRLVDGITVRLLLFICITLTSCRFSHPSPPPRVSTSDRNPFLLFNSLRRH